MNRFDIENCKLDGIYHLTRKPIVDHRGSLERMFCREDLLSVLPYFEIKQINRTITRAKGVVRGMPFQNSPFSEIKIITCIKGSVFDVAVDIRKGSATFGKWISIELSEEKQNSIIIPHGFAHGFQTLCENCEMLYFHSEFYTAGAEGGLSFKDESVGISWPLEVTEISDRDKTHPKLNEL